MNTYFDLLAGPGWEPKGLRATDGHTRHVREGRGHTERILFFQWGEHKLLQLRVPRDLTGKRLIGS